MTTLLLDTHVLFWLGAEPEQLSEVATKAIEEADELAVAGITWYELAWLARNDRIEADLPVGTWLSALANDVRSVAITPAIAATAASLQEGFPADLADRLIYATAIEQGWHLVTKDRRMHRFQHPGATTIW